MNDKINQTTIVMALAETWASMDGELERFQFERDHNIAPSDPRYDGHYDGYMSEAQEMLRRLEARGFVLVRRTA